MSIADWTAADLERFLKDRLTRPGFVPGQGIVGLDKFLTLSGRATRGTEDLTGTGASSASVAVTHGLTDANGDPLAPEQVFVTTNNGLILASVATLADTTFTLGNATIDGSTYSSTVSNHWLAVG